MGADGGLYLEVRGGDRLAIPESDALCLLLDRLTTDAWLRSAATRAGVDVPLLGLGSNHSEPAWLRAEELLDEAAACPGERLLAQTLAAAAEWRPGSAVGRAAAGLAQFVRSTPVLLGDVPVAAASQACGSLARIAGALPGDPEVRLVAG